MYTKLGSNCRIPRHYFSGIYCAHLSIERGMHSNLQSKRNSVVLLLQIRLKTRIQCEVFLAVWLYKATEWVLHVITICRKPLSKIVLLSWTVKTIIKALAIFFNGKSIEWLHNVVCLLKMVNYAFYVSFMTAKKERKDHNSLISPTVWWSNIIEKSE